MRIWSLKRLLELEWLASMMAAGVFSVMLNSVIAAQHPHNFIYRSCDVTTSGNELAHVILRGGVDKYGTCIPNYHYEDLMRLLEMYQKLSLTRPAVPADNSRLPPGSARRLVGKKHYVGCRGCPVAPTQ